VPSEYYAPVISLLRLQSARREQYTWQLPSEYPLLRLPRLPGLSTLLYRAVSFLLVRSP
jgi:hypothetical protein